MTTSQNQDSYLPLYDTVPDNWDQAKQILVEDLREISDAINTREIGWYIEDEVLTGKQCFSNATSAQLQDMGRSNVYRSIFRKVLDFGTLPNTTTKSVAHGITFDANFTLIHLSASATDPTGFTAIPIPTTTASIGMDATNVNIATTANLTNYTRCIVVIEYLKEV